MKTDLDITQNYDLDDLDKTVLLIADDLGIGKRKAKKLAREIKKRDDRRRREAEDIQAKTKWGRSMAFIDNNWGKILSGGFWAISMIGTAFTTGIAQNIMKFFGVEV